MLFMTNFEDLEAFRQSEFRDDPEPRCGFCGKIVSGDVTSFATPSELMATKRGAIPCNPLKNEHGDTEVYACDEGEGCSQ